VLGEADSKSMQTFRTALKESAWVFSLSFSLNPQFSANSLASQPRYMISAFPIFVIFALWGKRSCFDQIYVGIAIAMLAVNTLLFVAHYWVA